MSVRRSVDRGASALYTVDRNQLDLTPRGLAGGGVHTLQIAVKDVDESHRVLTELGTHIIAGPVPTPAGRNLIAMHPDGMVYEYVDRNT
mgnify:CR=1 FL=1